MPDQDLTEFARRVERVCDFLIEKVAGNSPEDLRILQDLKENAANLQHNQPGPTTIHGLSDYMRGL